MKTLPLLVLTAFLGLATVGSMTAQITVYQDSAAFDDDNARLRDIDFEDIYAMTVDRITIRNPYALQSLYMHDNAGQPTTDVLLELSQGATLSFPTRTRKVVLNGYSNPFYVHVTTFTDSTYTLEATAFPRTITDESGIARIQLFGTDAFGLDVNWHAGLYNVGAFDSGNDTLAYSNFDELEGDRYFFMGAGYDVSSVAETALIQPVDVHGITVDEPTIGFTGVHFADFEARADADNPIGNLGVVLYPAAAISFPAGTEGALLVVEQVHLLDTMIFEVTDYANVRDTLLVVGWGRKYDTAWVEEQRATYAHIGFGSADGIKEVRLLDAWTMEPYDIIDTVINGEVTEVVLYEPVVIETYLMAVHVAEAPPTEIGMLRSDIEEIGNAGYLENDQSAVLTLQLQDAESFAAAGDKKNAVSRLNDFGAEVDQLYDRGSLVVEEAVQFRNDADYVIARLQAGTLSVPPALRGGSEMPSLSDVSVRENGLSARYHIPGADGGEVVISDMRGRTVRTIPVNDGVEEGVFIWNLRDTNGREVPSGTYLLSLGSGRGSATAKVVLLR